ncbi:hypothetical protein NLX67_20575 [Domibacillus sp. A3M-37]|uniref:hypothetical protein n=1 Tax=Domibacillus sp. A3M-37 TaxID=2962037 RepID=UPI0020B7C844|nr:hypothetical protein [Domibacillus sp. A3M-37]MCP3764732.1 hypothetical protein [Domibacillus sp. A3M-37]
MVRKVKLFITLFMAIALFFTTYQPAEAANPIKPSQSRVTHTIKDANGNPYKIYFAGTKEKKAIASYDRWDWAAVSDEADEGDQLYTGNYTLYTHDPKTSHIYKSKFHFPGYLLNTTRKTVHIYPSKTKGQPDYLAIAYGMGYGAEMSDWYYMNKGKLTQVINGTGFIHNQRAKVMGKNTFLTYVYDPNFEDYPFMKFTINPATGEMGQSFPVYKDIFRIIEDWPKHWQ